MFQFPGEIDKESEAKKGIIKLMLLHVQGSIDIDSMSVTKINPASPSRVMQVVLNQPRAAQASQFADLVWMTLDLAKEQDYTNIQHPLIASVYSSHVKSTCISHASRKPMEKVTSLELKANSIKPSAYLPQKNVCLVEREKNNKVKAMLENVINFSDSHKIKGKTAISQIGTMISMTNFSSLCIT
jgi:hypothetical protein